MYHINEIKTRKDLFILDIREHIKNNGLMSLNGIEKKFSGYNTSLEQKLKRDFKINIKEFVKCIETEEIIHTQYSIKGDVENGITKSKNMWHYDPFREKHLIENIAKIGPEYSE